MHRFLLLLPLLGGYLAQLWHASVVQVGRLALEPVSLYCAWNAEAVDRCAVLSQEGSLPRNIRQLFASPGPRQPNLGCLLDQVPCFLPTCNLLQPCNCNDFSNTFSFLNLSCLHPRWHGHPNLTLTI